nr:MAG TPA: hypothetical protein [Caudoviricetes sp.]
MWWLTLPIYAIARAAKVIEDRTLGRARQQVAYQLAVQAERSLPAPRADKLG